MQTSFQNKKFSQDPQESEKKDVSVTECTAPNLLMAISDGLACFFFSSSISKPLQSMRMVLVIRLFEFRRRKDICSMYAKLLRCTVLRLRSGARHEETPRIGKTPSNEPISELDIFSKRQALSRACRRQ